MAAGARAILLASNPPGTGGKTHFVSDGGGVASNRLGWFCRGVVVGPGWVSSAAFPGKGMPGMPAR